MIRERIARRVATWWPWIIMLGLGYLTSKEVADATGTERQAHLQRYRIALAHDIDWRRGETPDRGDLVAIAKWSIQECQRSGVREPSNAAEILGLGR